MASYNPLTFGHFTPEQVIEKVKQKAAAMGYSNVWSDYYTIGYSGEYQSRDYYAVSFFRTSTVEMTGTNFVQDETASTTVRTGAIERFYIGVGIHVTNGTVDFYSGNWSFVQNSRISLFTMTQYNAAGHIAAKTWDNVNFYSTVTINNIEDDTFDYMPQNETAEFICTKDPDLYLIHLGVRANRNSNYTNYAYQTSAYTIRLKWTSPVTGYSFTVPLSGLAENVAHYTENAVLNTYNFSYTTTAGDYAKGIRCPAGSYAVIPPFVWDDLADVPSLRDVTLTELKAAAQTQRGGIINDDLFTVITVEFVYNNTVQATKTVDFSSLLGEDIDIGGNTVPNPNGDPSLSDTNVYTDEIKLTSPTLTATGVFNRCYVLDGNGVNDLCDYLYNANDSIFEEIIDGVLTRGNPIESLIDLRLYPFDVRTFTGAGTSESIKFGRTDTGIIGIKLPHNSNAVIDLGSCVVPRYYNNFLDYQTTAELYIPFCGVVDLPIDRILNHELSIKLIVDYITGAGTAVVFVDKIPLIYQQGIIGVSVPMTATDSAAFGQTIAGNLISGASAMISQNPAAMAKEALDTAGALWEGSRLMRIGASSPQTSLFQPLNAYLLLSIVSPASGVYDDEYAANIGYSCFMPVGQIGYTEGSGFTVFENVKMNIPQATEQEKELILSMLAAGVYM